jgi:hypothetical protein
MHLLQRFREFADDQPHLARSAFYGAGTAFAATAFRVLVLAPVYGPRSFLPALAAMVLATTAGALGGVFYGLLRPLGNVGTIGRWLRWTLGIALYLLALLGILAPFDDQSRSILEDPLGIAIGAALCIVYGGLATWLWPLIPESNEPKTPADVWLRRAMAEDLADLHQRGSRDPELIRFDLIDQRVPSHAYIMHLWRVVGRLGRIPGPSRQARIALRRAQRMLTDAERAFERSRTTQNRRGA